MAIGDRHAEPDVRETVGAQSMDFFELLRQLETDEHRLGRGGGPGTEPARLGQAIRLSFAVSDVVEVSKAEDPERPPKVAVNVFGLFGPEGPMPLHLTRWMLERASNRWFAGDNENATSDTAFLDFGNMLQHRMITFYWRAWADTRPEVQIRHNTGGSVAALVRSLAGVGLSAPNEKHFERTRAKLRHATSLFQQAQGPDRLTEYVSTVTGWPVELCEFVGVWTPIPEHLQSRLGQTASGLGTDAVVGSRFFECQSRAELRIGPLDLDNFTAFLDDQQKAIELRHAIHFAMGHGIEFDVCLLLDADEIPEPRLGTMRLGQISWLSRPEKDAVDDVRFRRFTSIDTPEEAAA